MVQMIAEQRLAVADEAGHALTRVRMGLSWDKERGGGVIGATADVDLDATALQFAGGTLFDLAFYNNLRTRDGSVEHLGDNRSGSGAGDDETIAVDLGAVHGPVDTILFLVSSYRGQALEWVTNAACHLSTEDGTELAHFTLTQGPRETGVVMAALTRGGTDEPWTLEAIGRGVPITVPTQGLAALAPFVQR